MRLGLDLSFGGVTWVRVRVRVRIKARSEGGR